MLRTLEERQKFAVRCFSDSINTLTGICPLLKMEFTLQEWDEEKLDFSINNIPFSISWNNIEVQGMGGKYFAVEFVLYVFHTTSGSRWNPPETIDTELVSSRSINICLRKALTTAFESVMNGALESH